MKIIISSIFFPLWFKYDINRKVSHFLYFKTCAVPNNVALVVKSHVNTHITPTFPSAPSLAGSKVEAAAADTCPSLELSPQHTTASLPCCQLPDDDDDDEDAPASESLCAGGDLPTRLGILKKIEFEKKSLKAKYCIDIKKRWRLVPLGRPFVRWNVNQNFLFSVDSFNSNNALLMWSFFFRCIHGKFLSHIHYSDKGKIFTIEKFQLFVSFPFFCVTQCHFATQWIIDNVLCVHFENDVGSAFGLCRPSLKTKPDLTSDSDQRGTKFQTKAKSWTLFIELGK